MQKHTSHCITLGPTIKINIQWDAAGKTLNIRKTCTEVIHTTDVTPFKASFHESFERRFPGGKRTGK